MWRVEVRVEDKNTGCFEDYNTGTLHLDLQTREEAIKWGAGEIRKHWKTSWSHEIPNINSVVYTEGVGIVGFINFWEV